MFESGLTVDVCLDYCKNFQYAALGNGENCYCVDKFPTIDILPDSDCNVPCEGDTTNKKCGGPSKWSVYRGLLLLTQNQRWAKAVQI